MNKQEILKYLNNNHQFRYANNLDAILNKLSDKLNEKGIKIGFLTTYYNIFIYLVTSNEESFYMGIENHSEIIHYYEVVGDIPL